MARPALFVGSSSEGKRIAEAVQVCLDPVCEVELWTQGTFGLTRATLDSLLFACTQFDFALLVLTADDLIISRNSEKSTARDNVLFELGLFIGALGRDRTFMLFDRTNPPSLPSDLAGISAATFAPHASGNLVAAVGAPCTTIGNIIERLGTREGGHYSDHHSSALIAEPLGLSKYPQHHNDQDDQHQPLESKQAEYAEISARVSSQVRLASLSSRQGQNRRDWFLVIYNLGATEGQEVTFTLEPVDVAEEPWLVLRSGTDRDLMLAAGQELRFPILPSEKSAREVQCTLSWRDGRGRQDRTIQLKLSDP